MNTPGELRQPIELISHFPRELWDRHDIDVHRYGLWLETVAKQSLCDVVGKQNMDQFDADKPIKVINERGMLEDRRKNIRCDIKRTPFGVRILVNSVLTDLQKRLEQRISQLLSRIVYECNTDATLRVNIDRKLHGLEIEEITLSQRRDAVVTPITKASANQ